MCTHCVHTVSLKIPQLQTFLMAEKGRGNEIDKQTNQRQYGSHMIRSNDIMPRWCLASTSSSMVLCNFHGWTGATNTGLPQKRHSRCSQPRKSPLRSIAAPKLWGEEKKEKDIWYKQLCGLYPRVGDSVTPAPLWHQTAFPQPLRSFSFLHSKPPCNLPHPIQQIELCHSQHLWVKQSFCTRVVFMSTTQLQQCEWGSNEETPLGRRTIIMEAPSLSTCRQI